MVPPYVPGAAAPSRTGIASYKLSANENPYPPLPSVAAAIADAAALANRYPDMSARALFARLAEAVGAPESHLALGTGSVGVLQQVMQTVIDPGDEVVYAWRSFEAYPIVTAIAGGTSVQVPLDANENHDLGAMAAAVAERTRLVLLCSPNNPTGTALHHEDVVQFLEAIPDDVLVVIDEAYGEFVRYSDPVDALALYRERPNVALLRTFSKAYGLAGLRVGYAIAQPSLAAALRKTAVPFGVSEIAQRAAIASLDATDELLLRVDALVAERERVVRTMRAAGWQVADTQANFFWLRLGADTEAFAAACADEGLAVRPFAGEGVRVTIGELAANEAFMDLAVAWLRARAN
jgi:histidinol-phosphate aminotransferase